MQLRSVESRGNSLREEYTNWLVHTKLTNPENTCVSNIIQADRLYLGIYIFLCVCIYLHVCIYIYMHACIYITVKKKGHKFEGQWRGVYGRVGRKEVKGEM